MTKRLILDSGAFTVWTQGASVNLQRYIDFCLHYPEITHCVSLDVIPGKKGERCTPLQVEAACLESYDNYQIMKRSMPGRSVMPVFHFKDDIKWLHRYLEEGVPYVGLGGLVFADTPARLKFLKSLRRILFDGAGRPLVKVHGFGLTSFDVMSYWDWHSVDSTSWKQTGSWGGIYVAKIRGGSPNYAESPHVVAVTPQSPKQKVKQQHLNSMSPMVREAAMAQIAAEGFVLGEWEIIDVSREYSIKRGSAETWHSRVKRQVLRPIVDGLATSFEERCKWNWRYMRKVNKALPVKYLYAAGARTPYVLEYRMTNRLLSYAELQNESGRKCVAKHCQSILGYQTLDK